MTMPAPDAAAVPASTPRPGTRLGVVFLVLFLDLVGFSIVFPLFAAMLEHYEKANDPIVLAILGVFQSLVPSADAGQRAAFFGGLLAAGYAGLQFLAAPWWGRLSDRIGRRPVILWSLLGSVLAYSLWAFTASFAFFALSRLCAGVLSGNVSAASAAVADMTTTESRGRGMAVVGMAFGLGFILGPAIGGLTSTITVPSWAPHPFVIPALVAVILSLGNLIWAWVSFTETLAPERRSTVAEDAGRTANPLRIFSSSLGSGVPAINGTVFFHTLLFAGMESTLVFLLAQCLGFKPIDCGWVFAAMGFGSALIQGGIFRRVVATTGPRPLAVLGFLFLAPGFAVVGLVAWWPATWILWIGVALLAFGTGLVFPALNTCASLSAGERNQGQILGTFRSASALGRALGPILGAACYFLLSPGAPYLVAAAGVIIPILLLRRVTTR